MLVTSITFFVAFLALISMIGQKSREIRMGKISWLSGLNAKLDTPIEKAYTNTRTFISYFNRKSAVALIQWIAYHILSWARSGYIMLHRKAHAHPPSKKVIDMVRGKGEVDTVGGASFYLKRISKES